MRPERPNQAWTYDFLEDRTEGGKKLRILTVLDEYTRESLNITVDTSITAGEVIMVLDWLFLTRGAPEHIRSDNGPEFVAKAVQKWLREKRCDTIYIRPGSPWENPQAKGRVLESISISGYLGSSRDNRGVAEGVQSVPATLTPMEYAAQACMGSGEVVQTVVAIDQATLSLRVDQKTGTSQARQYAFSPPFSRHHPSEGNVRPGQESVHATEKPKPTVYLS